MFEKFKTFWNVFIDSIKQAYNKAFKPIEDTVQSWRDTGKINLLDIFVGKLNNLANTEATFEIISDSTQAEPLKKLCKDIANDNVFWGKALFDMGNIEVNANIMLSSEVTESNSYEQLRELDCSSKELENTTKTSDLVDKKQDYYEAQGEVAKKAYEVYENIVKYDKLIVDEAAVKVIEEVYAR